MKELKEINLEIKNYKKETPIWCDEHHEKVGKGGRARKRSKFKNK